MVFLVDKFTAKDRKIQFLRIEFHEGATRCKSVLHRRITRFRTLLCKTDAYHSGLFQLNMESSRTIYGSLSHLFHTRGWTFRFCEMFGSGHDGV